MVVRRLLRKSRRTQDGEAVRDVQEVPLVVLNVASDSGMGCGMLFGWCEW